jgi:hypothetical protein
VRPGHAAMLLPAQLLRAVRPLFVRCFECLVPAASPSRPGRCSHSPLDSGELILCPPLYGVDLGSSPSWRDVAVWSPPW